MIHNQNYSSNNNQYKINEYKEYAFRNRKNLAKLIATYIHKFVGFYKDCKKDIQKMDLADTERGAMTR